MPLLLDKKAKQEHTNKDSLFYINREGAHYNQLQTILASSRPVFIYRNGFSEDEITLRSQAVEHIFTFNAIGAICPLLLSSIIYSLGVDLKMYSGNRGQIAQFIWQHCDNPGMKIREASGLAVYVTELAAIINVEKGGKEVSCTARSYFMQLEEKAAINSKLVDGYAKVFIDKVTPFVINAEHNLLTKNIPIDLSVLEQLYPGFSERLTMANNLGFSPEDLLEYAIDTAYNDESALPKEVPHVLSTNFEVP